MNEEEIKFRAYLLILNSEFPIHRKKEAMEEMIKIYNKQQKEIKKLKEKNKEMFNQYEKRVNELEREIAINSISKDKIKEKINYYEERGYIEIAGAFKLLLEE